MNIDKELEKVYNKQLVKTDKKERERIEQELKNLELDVDLFIRDFL